MRLLCRVVDGESREAFAIVILRESLFKPRVRMVGRLRFTDAGLTRR